MLVLYIWGVHIWLPKLRDLRFGLRALRRAPSVTVFIIATIALGIAANTTVFTILNTFLLNPLPVRNAGELVAVTSADTGRQMNSGTLLPISYLNLRDIATRNTSFQAFAGYTSPTTMTLSEAAGPRRMFAEIVTGDYFDTLGVRPA